MRAAAVNQISTWFPTLHQEAAKVNLGTLIQLNGYTNLVTSLLATHAIYQAYQGNLIYATTSLAVAIIGKAGVEYIKAIRASLNDTCDIKLAVIEKENYISPTTSPTTTSEDEDLSSSPSSSIDDNWTNEARLLHWFDLNPNYFKPSIN